jgi:hypothetical protein
MANESDATAPDSKRCKLFAESDVPHAVQRINLQLILQYVGAGDWFYMAGVSSLWQQVYRSICEENAQQQKQWVLKKGKRCYVGPVKASRTHYTKAFTSLSRLQLACALGLKLDRVECLQQQAGRIADKQTLLWARAQGLLWDEYLTLSLADQGRLDVLQWAQLEEQCPVFERGIVDAALKRADLPMLRWLHSVVDAKIIKEQARLGSLLTATRGFVGSVRVLAWLQSAELINLRDEQQRDDLSNAAIASGHVHTLQWLRSKELYELDVDVMQWEGEELFPSIVAARRGHYSMIKYLRELNHDYIFSYDARREAVSSGNLQLLAYLVEQGIDSWRPEELADTDADQYMPECLTIAGKQVRYCLLVVHSLT